MLKDRATPIDKFLTAICHQHGIETIAVRLKEMLEMPLSHWDTGLSNRAARWLNTLCRDSKLADEQKRLAELCEVATVRFCGYYCNAANHRIDDRSIPDVANSLELLLQAMFSTAQDQLAAKLVASVRSLPQRFTRDNSQVYCLLKLIPWSQKTLKQVHPVLAQWSAAVRAELVAATSQPPQEPTNWTRPAKIEDTYGMLGVSRNYKSQLNRFLADPTTETLTILAAEYERSEIIRTVNSHQCDVTHRLEKKGNRYQLVFTKTRGSYERAMKQHADDLKMLTALEAVMA